MNIELTSEEARVLGCLMEKSVLTRDQYPLTLNALTNACNQKSSRDPVMSLEQGVVQRTVRDLERKGFVRIDEAARGSRVERYTQRLFNTPFGELQVSEAEFAVMCLLLLRGPQTPGELRTRSGRLYTFADNQAVASTLQGLIEREGGSLVVRLPRAAGRQDSEYMHLLCGPVDATALAESPERPAGSTRTDRLAALEARLESVERELAALRARIDGAPAADE